MNKLQITYVAPQTLVKNPWNPNKVDPINQQKLTNSIKKGMFKPILVRTLADDSLEIIGGEHRVEALIELGHEEIPILNLGEITDSQAKDIALKDNEQYGELDYQRFAEIVGDGDLGDMNEFLSEHAMDQEELVNIFDSSLDDLESIDMGDEDDDGGIDLEPTSPAPRTHQILRFKVPAEDADVITSQINRVKHEQGFTESDELSNAGDSLVHIFRGLSDDQ